VDRFGVATEPTRESLTLPPLAFIQGYSAGKRMNYYQHHIGDFIRDTARLSDAQCMAYLRMIWLYYETELPLDNDADAIGVYFAFKKLSEEK
jgi:hypothetical protein